MAREKIQPGPAPIFKHRKRPKLQTYPEPEFWDWLEAYRLNEMGGINMSQLALVFLKAEAKRHGYKYNGGGR